MPEKAKGSLPQMFAQTIRKLRESQNLSQQQIANALQIDRSTYSYYELGKSHPDYDGLVKLSKLFNVSINFLLGVEENHCQTLHSDDFQYKTNPKNSPTYLSELTAKEQNLILAFRLVPEKDKESAIEYLQNLLHTEK